MTPRDSYGYFDVPTVTQFDVPNWSGVVLPENPDRVVFAVLSDGASKPVIQPLRTQPVAIGWDILTADGYLVVTQQLHGPLCQMQWVALADATVRATVIQIVLNRFPGVNPTEPPSRVKEIVRKVTDRYFRGRGRRPVSLEDLYRGR